MLKITYTRLYYGEHVPAADPDVPAAVRVQAEQTRDLLSPSVAHAFWTDEHGRRPLMRLPSATNPAWLVQFLPDGE